mmetsp:Transcript_4643/g.13473  ORF Transcript_4643/g.13473 Transcript_4643/m.13473 type:complete len:205 (-) Transcript_4643:719-1333(-)
MLLMWPSKRKSTSSRLMSTMRMFAMIWRRTTQQKETEMQQIATAMIRWRTGVSCRLPQATCPSITRWVPSTTAPWTSSRTMVCSRSVNWSVLVRSGSGSTGKRLGASRPGPARSSLATSAGMISRLTCSSPASLGSCSAAPPPCTRGTEKRRRPRRSIGRPTCLSLSQARASHPSRQRRAMSSTAPAMSLLLSRRRRSQTWREM